MDPSPSETHRVKVTSPKSKVTGPKCHTHVHLSLISSPQAQIDHVGIRVHKNLKAKVIPPRSKVTGPNSAPMYIHYRHKLATLAIIPFGHSSIHKIPMVKVVALRLKVTGQKFHGQMHLAPHG